MNKFIMPEGTGKTYQLIRMSEITGDYIVCESPREAERIQSVANELGFNIPFPMTYREFIFGKYHGKGISGVLIDNADCLLQYLAKDTVVDAITLTDEN